MKKAAITSLLGVMILGLLMLGIYLVITEDKEGPKILFGEEEILYTKGESEDILLADVSAVDEKDGDVSQSIIIESVIPLLEGAQGKVIYVAKDSHNNITKISRMITYIEETEENKKSAKNRKEEAEEAEEATEEDEIESEADTETTSEEVPTIELTQSEVKVERGTTVNFMNYIDSVVDDKDEESTLYRRIRIGVDAVDINKSGTYEVVYYVLDTDGNASEKQTLSLIVE